MTISATTSRWEFDGDGSTDEFDYDNIILATSDLKVYVDDTLQTETTNYSVSGAGDVDGGTVTFVSAPADGTKIVIVRDIPQTQATDYPAGGTFPAASHEAALDKLTLLVQDLQEQIDRSYKASITDDVVTDVTVPEPAAGQILTWQANGTLANSLLESIVTDIDITNTVDRYESVSSFIAATPSGAFAYITSYYGGWAATTAGPKGGHYVHRTGGTNSSPTVGTAVSVSSIGTGTQAGYYWDADGVEWEISDNQEVNIFMFGAVGGGITDDTAAIQAATNSGANHIIVPDDNFLVSSVAVPASVDKISGSGTLTQTATGNKTFTTTSDALEITGLTFVGAATANSSSLADDTAIEATGCSDLKIHNNTFKNYSFNTVFLVDCTDSTVSHNFFDTVAHAVRLRGCYGCSVIGNFGKDTILISTAQSIPIGLDSTNGHAYGVCENIVIANNRFYNNPYGEGILVHAGRRVSITGNVFSGLSFGIGINPFNATDDIQDISVVGNSLQGTTSSDWTTSQSSDADEAIFVGGSAITTRPTGICIIGNTITRFNHVVDQANQGGIVVSYSEDVSVSGNTIRDCRNNGIAVVEDSLGLVISNNAISDIVFNAGNSLKNGIRLNNASANAFIYGNIIRDVTGTNSYGIRADSGTIQLGQNHFQNVDDHFGDFGGTITSGYVQSYTSGTTVNLNNTDIVEFDASSGAITIGTGNSVWSNVILNKVYKLRNVGASNNVTVSRDATYCKCASGADIVLAPGESVEIIGRSAVNVVEQYSDKTTAIS